VVDTRDSFSGEVVRAPAPAGGPMPSTSFGKYELLDLLAIGGMAEIFLAKSASIGGITRACVIKRILPKYSTDRQFVSMFIDEARITIGLDHPNIVRLFDFGQVDGSYYMAIEYVDGCDLVDLLRELKRRGEGMLPEAAAYLARCIAAGLHHAHVQKDHRGQPMGIVHRDVSPQNVFIGWDGSVKVGDFGIASARNKLTRTIPGTVKGKFGYMSPEQAMGGNLDARADVWAAGVVLQEMLIGARLFGGESVVQTLAKICEGPIAKPSSKKPAVPSALDVVSMRALERELGRRYPNAGAMVAELDAYLGKTGFGAAQLAQYLAELGVKDGVQGRRKPGQSTAPAIPSRLPDAASAKNPRAPMADEHLRRLRGELRREKNLWTLVDLGERHFALGETHEALAAYRTAAAVFAHRGLLVQAICALAPARVLLAEDEYAADLRVLADLRGGGRKLLVDHLHRVDTGSFWLLVQEADPSGLGNDAGEETALVPSTPLFGKLDADDFVALAGIARVEKHPPGQVVVREGESGLSLYAVGRGRLAGHCVPGSDDGTFATPGEAPPTIAPRESPSGTLADTDEVAPDRIYLSALADGDFFGEMSFLTGRPRSATVETIAACSLLRIDQTTVEQILQRDPSFQDPLLEFYKERVAELMLAKNPVFSLLEPDDRRQLLRRSALKKFADEDVIVAEGRVEETMFFIKHGEVEIYRTQDGFPVFINKLREGQFFGEVAALKGTPRTASVKAMGAVEVFCIDRGDLDEVLDRSKRVRGLFEEAIAARMSETEERVAETQRIFEGV
jgi:serine/threonine protein kinase/CRP-like cAMP-binding protein